MALTADQDPYGMFHMEDQCIDQVDMFHGYVKCAVDVPMVRDEKDYWYCNRRINDALRPRPQRKGPVRINYHMSYGLAEIATFDVAELPKNQKDRQIRSDPGSCGSRIRPADKKTHFDRRRIGLRCPEICGRHWQNHGTLPQRGDL